MIGRPRSLYRFGSAAGDVQPWVTPASIAAACALVTPISPLSTSAVCWGVFPLKWADGVQIGTRFALTEESSAHFTFKDRCLRLNEGDTQLTLKQLSPVRLVKNEFFKQVEEAETRGASVEELRELLGKGRAKKGIFEGDIYEGEVEIGQIASSVHSLKTAEEVIKELINDFNAALKRTKEIPSFIL